ncbi:Protein of unknown function [Pyronema omphalodes CBS 100304]|uniref:Uncharacterized protein n=1 Tax=Pyronema omphalodes (strain CBS 100304) TaxID=1076935 RepID=U4LHW3_PYROM|nr:Protein of unknown function [Pyronema omphalodes CBS 100304]
MAGIRSITFTSRA